MAAIGTGIGAEPELDDPRRCGAVVEPTLFPIRMSVLLPFRLPVLPGSVRAGGGGGPLPPTPPSFLLLVGLLWTPNTFWSAAVGALRAVVRGAARLSASIPSCSSCLALWPRRTDWTNVRAESISDLCFWKNLLRAFFESFITFACVACWTKRTKKRRTQNFANSCQHTCGRV